MKFDGIREVKSICYPNDYVVIKKKGKLLNILIINLVLCLVVAAGIVAIKYFGGGAEDVLNIITDALNAGTAV